jgi:peptidoglycan/LPS O-acetylase OafA/YrhL
MWYYALFPLLLLAWRTGQPPLQRIVIAFAFVLACVLLPHELIKYGGIWLIGVAVSLSSKQLVRVELAWLLLAAFLSSASLNVLTVSGVGFAHVVGTAVSVALIINAYQFSAHARPPRLLQESTELFSNFSYSVYLFHFPMLVTLSHAIFAIQPHSAISFVGLLEWSGTIVALYAYSYLMFLLSEQHYHRLRKFIYQNLGSRATKVVEQHPAFPKTTLQRAGSRSTPPLHPSC